MRGAGTLDGIHPVLGSAGVGLVVTPSAEVRVVRRGSGGRERGELARCVGTNSSAVQSEPVSALSLRSLSCLVPLARPGPGPSGSSLDHFLLTRPHVFVTTKEQR